MKKIILILLVIFSLGFTTQKIVCDYCDVEYNGFDNWYRLSTSIFLSDVDQSYYDFCSLEHLKLWAEKQTEDINDYIGDSINEGIITGDPEPLLTQ